MTARKKLARSEADNKRFRHIVSSAADEMQDLAGMITRGIDTLPANRSKASVELFEHQARRALGLAAAFRVEEPDPEPVVCNHLFGVRSAVGALTLGIVGTVAVGAGEAAGADIWEAVSAAATEIVITSPAPKELDVPAEWGSMIRAARAERGLTQAQLANKLGVSQQTIGSWETGRTMPREELAAKVQQVLFGGIVKGLSSGFSSGFG